MENAAARSEKTHPTTRSMALCAAGIMPDAVVAVTSTTNNADRANERAVRRASGASEAARTQALHERHFASTETFSIHLLADFFSQV